MAPADRPDAGVMGSRRVQSYAGRVAVVTGASSGLGRRMALDLAARGALVVGLARREDRLAEVAERLKQASAGSSTRACDVRDSDRYAAVLRELEREHGRIDVLVNCAGIASRSLAEHDSLERYRETLDTNFFATVAGTLAVLPGMLRRGEGSILNVSSDQGRAPSPWSAAYCASKAAVSSFSESVSYEVEQRGVHVHVLYPGWVPTAMGQAALDAGMPRPPRLVQRTEEQVSRLALDRMGGPDFEINAARVAILAPVLRALLPRVYRRGILRASAG